MFKESFQPIASAEIKILILGSIPGDKSLELQQYYGHPRNRFWKMMAILTAEKEPIEYSDKIALLLRNKIGLWDVARMAQREGSLDSAIRNEQPNDIDTFLQQHSNVHTIAFNGQKARNMFDKFFQEKSNIRYYTMPSTSPANASADLTVLCERWQKMLV